MSKDRNQAAATATFGLGGVAGGAALRHYGLADAYGEMGHDHRPREKRPAVFAERRLLKAPHGRRKFLLGAGLAALSAPAAAKGTYDLWHGGKRRTFVEEGVSGVAESLRERNTKENRTAPVGLRARNYAVGAATTGATGGAAHLLMRRTKIPHAGRASIASVGGVLAGVATLPAQSKITQRASRGKYIATPTGLKRVVEPTNHGARHGTRLAKRNDAVTGMSREDELKAIKRKRRTANVNAVTSAGGVGSLALLGAAALPHVPNRGRLVRAATTVGTGSAGIGAVNGLEGAHLARRDLKARERVLTGTSKALTVPGVLRAPRVRRGFLRQTRSATGVTTSTVRGGLIR